VQEPGRNDFIPLIPVTTFMAKILRVEITDKALKVLKVEAALRGQPQRETLEALILSGAPPRARALALVEEEPLMEVAKMESKPVTPKKDKIKKNPVKPKVDKMEEKPIMPKVDKIESNGVKAHNTPLDLMPVKIFTKPMIGRIKKLI